MYLVAKQHGKMSTPLKVRVDKLPTIWPGDLTDPPDCMTLMGWSVEMDCLKEFDINFQGQSMRNLKVNINSAILQRAFLQNMFSFFRTVSQM